MDKNRNYSSQVLNIKTLKSKFLMDITTNFITEKKLHVLIMITLTLGN